MVRVPLPMAKSRPRGDSPGFGGPGHYLTRLEKGVRLPAINWPRLHRGLGRQRVDMGNSGLVFRVAGGNRHRGIAGNIGHSAIILKL